MFNKIKVEDLRINVFTKLDKEWALVCVGDEKENNAMTISWGNMGVLWNKYVVTVFIRPTRYTHKLMEENEYFTLSFFDESKKDILKFCGVKSGKDVDKAKALNLTPIILDNGLTYNESNLVFVLKKIANSKFIPSNFIDQEINKNYSIEKQDYHHIYIGEIINIYSK